MQKVFELRNQVINRSEKKINRLSIDDVVNFTCKIESISIENDCVKCLMR